MMCPQCGQQLNDDATHCIGCGCRLYQIEQPRPKRKKTIPFLVVLLIIAVAAAAVFAFLYFSNRSPQEPAVPAVQETLDPASLETSPPDSADTTSPQETLPEAPTLSTEATEATDPAENDRLELSPENQVAPGAAGIPLPSVSEEARKQAFDTYWQTITNEEDAVSYSLLNMLGDDIPELIIRCGQEDSDDFYRIYFLLNGKPLPVNGETIPAGQKDVLLGNNGDLLIRCQDALTTVDIDLSLTARTSSAKISKGSVVYTDTVLTESADSKGLLALVLMGDSEETCYNGWVRCNGKDYFYANRNPVTQKWQKEDTGLYYLGADGYVTHKAEAEALDAILQEYCQSFMDMVNNQDISCLKNVTEAYRKDIQTLLNEDEYRYRTYSDFICSSEISDQHDNTGSITLTVKIKWTFCGEWEGAQTATQNQLCYMTLLHQDGRWLINKLEYPR